MLGKTIASLWIVFGLANAVVGQSTSAPATQPAGSARTYTSYDQLRRSFSERQTSLSRMLLRERMAALDSFVATAKGEDLENACRDFVSVASELGQYARVVEIADRFAKEFASSSAAANVASMRISAIAEQGKLDQAVADWARFADTSKPADWGFVCDAGIRLGDVLTLAGRTAEARKQYDEVGRRMSRYPNVGMFLGRRTAGLNWIGRQALALEGNDLAGKPARIEEYRGRVLLLDFWATTCGPCLREMPGVIKTYEDHHAEGFDVIGVSVDRDLPALKAFLAQNKVPWRQVFDGQGGGSPNAGNYDVRAVPTMFLIGRDGKIAFMPLSADDLDYALSKLLKKTPGSSASAER